MSAEVSFQQSQLELSHHNPAMATRAKISEKLLSGSHKASTGLRVTAGGQREEAIRVELPQAPSSTIPVGADASALRDQLTKLQGLVGLSMVLTERADASQIAKLASSVVSSLAPVRCDGVFVAKRGWLEAAGPCLRREVRRAIEKQLRGLPGRWGSVQIADEPWAWALPMRSFEGALGHLVIAGEGPIQESEQLLLRMLAQQLGIAIENADSHARERATARELETVNLRLERSLAIHSRLTQAEVEGRGMRGIAEIVHELTGYPVVIEDSRGKRLASAGLGPSDPEEQASDWQPDFEELTCNHLAAVRLGDRLAAACGTFGETFAVSRSSIRAAKPVRKSEWHWNTAQPCLPSNCQNFTAFSRRSPVSGAICSKNCFSALMTSGLGCELRCSGTTWVCNSG